jgi:hypothetical protein
MHLLKPGHKPLLVIKNGWARSSMHPFNPEKVLGYVLIPLFIEPPLRSLTLNSISPLNDSDLTSSPCETPAMNVANNDIKKHACTHSAEFCIPKQKHVVQVTKALGCSLALNRVQATQLADLQRILSTCQQRQSSEYIVLRRETLIAAPEMRLRLESEKEKPKSKPGRSKKPATENPSTPPPLNLTPAHFLNSMDSESDSELPDSIVAALA